jgi:hypothetical protein
MKNSISFSQTTTLVVGSCLLSLLPLPAKAYTIAPTGITPETNIGYSSLYTVADVLVGDAFRLNWSLKKGPDFPTLQAEAVVQVTELTSTELEMKVWLKNTTHNFKGKNDVALKASIPIFGFDIDGFSSGSLSKPGTRLKTYAIGGISGISNQFCVGTNQSCTIGNTKAGIPIGGSDHFTVSIAGNFDPIAGVDLKNFGTKWQTNYQDLILNVSSNNVSSSNSSKSSNYHLSATPSPLEIPEPSIISPLALIGVALFLGAGNKSSRN